VISAIRRTLDIDALRQIFDDLTPADFQHWERVLEQMRLACLNKDLQAIAEMDIAFHHYLLVCAKEPDLLVIWEMLAGRIQSHFLQTQQQCPSVMEIYEEHHALLEAFRTKSLTEAVRLLKKSIH